MKKPFKTSTTQIKIPLRYSKSQHLIGTFELNGQTATLLIDTGASNSCIDQSKTALFNLIAEGDSLPLTGAGNEKLFAQSSQKSSLAYDDKEIIQIALMLIDMDTINTALKDQGEEAIDGIIGADILHQKKAIIDYHQCCLYLEEASWL